MEEETKYFRRELNKKNKETNKDKSYERRPNTSAKDNEKASVGSQSKLWVTSWTILIAHLFYKLSSFLSELHVKSYL